MEPTATASHGTVETDTTTSALVERHFTTPGQDPLDEVQWKAFEVDPKIVRLDDQTVEAPAGWSQNAVNIVAKLYLAKGDYKELSVRELIERVATKITDEACRHGYFETSVDGAPYDDEAAVFYDELRYILVNQLAAFNSPVWFNVGRPDRPQQVSACFILSVDDTSESIMSWVHDEAFIFKGGSGAGANLSRLRGSMEKLSTGGTASGPVSFMRVADSGAGTFKSGGTTRRAAKLVCLDADHPDIHDFVWAKPEEERRLKALHAAGFNLNMNDPVGERNLAAAASFQNANNSVRVTQDFMERATGVRRHPADWPLTARKTGEIVDKIDAGTLLDEIAQAAWECADPGLQFHDTTNAWHTTPIHGAINASNPCAEYVSNDDTSCNLASLNVVKFLNEDGLKIDDFRHTVDVMFLAQEITIAFADFPTEKITERTRALRQLGLGYSNMGAAIMSQGLAYDSPEARDFAAKTTALMTGRAYRQSALIAERMGPFEGFAENRDAMLRVIDKHGANLPGKTLTDVWLAASYDWGDAKRLGREHGYRNAQATLLAPAGSISYLMDCDTTGIEPAFSLVSYKQLAGGGSMTLVNRSVPRALRALGFPEEEIKGLCAKLESDDPESFIRSLPHKHQPVFHDAGEIDPGGHVQMVAAVQPFLSGAISKTINLPNETTWERIRDLYVEAWRRGLKAVSIYRDGSKASQVLMSKPAQPKAEILTSGMAEIPHAETPYAEDQYEGQVGPQRRRMPRDADMQRHKFNVGGFEGYILAGKFEDGTLGEMFLEDIGKEGSAARGMMNAFAIAISIGLQYGVPLEVFVRKYSHMTFEPNGPTENPSVPMARSLPDYIMRHLASIFLDADTHEELGILTPEVKARMAAELDEQTVIAKVTPTSNGNGHIAPVAVEGICRECGSLMHRSGSCFTCPSCGNNTGCG